VDEIRRESPHSVIETVLYIKFGELIMIARNISNRILWFFHAQYHVNATAPNVKISPKRMPKITKESVLKVLRKKPVARI
jgi:hypothetical protein